MKTGLFKNYVKSFLKMKQESSGFPEEMPEEAKRECILSYEKNEDIIFENDNI